MSAELFWLNNAQWEAILPHLPVKQRGPKRISDRTVISGIIHVLESGCTWRACPSAYGPYMTVFNRYNRWKQRGLWQRILAEVRNSDQFDDLAMCERLIRASACGGSSADGIDAARLEPAGLFYGCGRRNVLGSQRADPCQQIGRWQAEMEADYSGPEFIEQIGRVALSYKFGEPVYGNH